MYYIAYKWNVPDSESIEKYVTEKELAEIMSYEEQMRLKIISLKENTLEGRFANDCASQVI